MVTFLLSSQKSQEYSVSEIIIKIRNGDRELKNQFIGQYRPFVLKSVSKFMGRKYIDIENTEEYSIALIAFDEAINCYDESKNRNFFDFAGQVIKRRIINYWAGNQRQNSREYPFIYFQNDDGEFLEKIPDETPSFTQSYEIKEEIQLFKDRLAEFGITFKDLVLSSPSHKDSKLLGIKIARMIANNEDLFHQMMTRKVLPMQSLLKNARINKRTLERNRRFIIAVSLIMRSDLEILKSYINQHLQDSENK